MIAKGNILVTGCAGFIGSSLVDRLLADNYKVIGIDNFNNYYDPEMKESNLSLAKNKKEFKLYRFDILDTNNLNRVFAQERPTCVIHLAARAGVRSSMVDPMLYAQVNALGTVNILWASVKFGTSQIIFGSSSSVYGNSRKIPFSEEDLCQDIISPYAASKRTAEFFVEVFAKNFGIKSTVLRLFTVYGERGRPDMAPALFTGAILAASTIKQFGDGSSSRDYTYIGDAVEGIIKAINHPFDFEIINLGNNKPTSLKNFIELIEKITQRDAKVEELPVQSGDVEMTWASIDKAHKLLGWQPNVSLENGLGKYIKWFSQNG